MAIENRIFQYLFRQERKLIMVFSLESKKIKRYFSFLIFFSIFCLLLFVWQGIYSPKGEKRDKIFKIEKGQNLFQIAQNLEKEGIIKNRFFFDLYVIARGKSKQLKAGVYLFNPSLMDISKVAKKIIEGEVLKEKITIVEGWSLREIASFFEKKGIFQKEEFLEIAKKDFSQDFPFLEDKPKESDLEGYLFPDTYEINYSEEPATIIRKMLKNFDRKLTQEIRKEIARQGKKIFEIVTMASLIEKEIYNTKECPDCKNLVSGILWKRLKEGIPLQVDATITYITGKKTTQISIEETKIENPYNTYKYLGLPPGPICNPGLESILAALYPKESDYWYYLTTPSGQVIFSKTLLEHNLAKAEYLR